MEISGLDQQMDSYGTLGKSLLNRGFYGLMTVRTIEDLDDMFCGVRLHFREVFGKTLPGRYGFSKRAEALGTMGQGMEFDLIDVLRNGATHSRMPFLSAWFLGSSLGRSLFIGSLHPRGSGRILGGGGAGGLFQFLHSTIQFKEFLNRRLLSRMI